MVVPSNYRTKMQLNVGLLCERCQRTKKFEYSMTGFVADAILIGILVQISSSLEYPGYTTTNLWGSLPVFPRVPGPIYSVLEDTRSEKWSTDLPELSKPTSILPVRFPLFRVTLGVDLSSPYDLSLVDILLYQPLPMELYIAPVYVNSSSANYILTRCYGSIFPGEEDRSRVRDFLRALDQHTWLSKPPEKWTRVRDHEAILACQVFTKDLTGVKQWINGPYDPFPRADADLAPLTAIVNGRQIKNATIETLVPVLISSQSDVLNRLKREL